MVTLQGGNAFARVGYRRAGTDSFPRRISGLGNQTFPEIAINFAVPLYQVLTIHILQDAI